MAEYGNFLRTLFPVFKTLLLERIPVSFRDDDSNRFRRIVLEILNRLLNKILYNQQDVLRPYTLELLDLATQTLSTDNEENALTCLHIIFNLHKNYRSGVCMLCKQRRADAVEKPSGRCTTCWTCAQAQYVAAQSQAALPAASQGFAGSFVQICLRDEVQTFLDLVQAIYKRLKTSVSGTFQPSILAEAAKAAAGEMTGGTSLLSIAGNGGAGAATFTAMTTTTAAATLAAATPAGAAAAGTTGVSSAAAAVPTGATAKSTTTGVGSGEAPSLTSTSPPPTGSSATGAASAGGTSSEPLLRGMDSFKVLTECPLIVMLLFQLYHEFISSIPQPSGNIPQLVPLMMEGLQLSAPREAMRLQRTRFKEFVACQVKTLSFLTYLLRGFAELMRPYEDAISRAVIALMKACPGEAVSTRRELLVATRHILATDFKKGQSDLSLDACMHDPRTSGSLQLV